MVTSSKEIGSVLSEMGYRLTPQRMLILSAIQSKEDHISAEEIHAEVRAQYPYVNISTIYRTLEWLKELGLVVEIDLGASRVQYHWAEKCHHHHLICEECGAVIELDNSLPKLLEEGLQRRYGFKADLRHMAIFGHCKNCQG